MKDLSHGGHHDDPHKGMMSSHASHAGAEVEPVHDAHGEKTHGVSEASVVEDDVFATELAYGVGEEEHHISPESLDPDTGYFLEKLLGHEREGFLWQKLRRPTAQYKLTTAGSHPHTRVRCESYTRTTSTNHPHTSGHT